MGANACSTPGRLLPAAAEFLRAASGVVGILALLVIAAGIGSNGRPEPAVGSDPSSLKSPPPKPGLRAAAPPSPPSTAATMVFYLVSTPAQEAMADSGENVDESDTWRTYRILYARDAIELELARQTFLTYLLTQNDSALVRVVDMRTAP
jgi:hypothetical protein